MPSTRPRTTDQVSEQTIAHGRSVVHALARATRTLRMTRVELQDITSALSNLTSRTTLYANTLTSGLTSSFYNIYQSITGVDARVPGPDELLTSRVKLSADPRVASLVRDLTGEQYSNLSSILERGFAAGDTPAQLASRISAHVGLSARDSSQLEVYRRSQLAAGIDPRVVEQRVLASGSKRQATRVATIAQTEITRATALASELDWTFSAEAGEVPSGSVKVWVAPPDDKVDIICRGLNGTTVDIGTAFAFETFVGNGPPAHPNCRCAIALVVPAVSTRPTAAAEALVFAARHPKS
jgi:hypothetical protein